MRVMNNVLSMVAKYSEEIKAYQPTTTDFDVFKNNIRISVIEEWISDMLEIIVDVEPDMKDFLDTKKHLILCEMRRSSDRTTIETMSIEAVRQNTMSEIIKSIDWCLFEDIL